MAEAWLEVVKEYPPNIDKIDAALHVRKQVGIIYAYGGKIYAPDSSNDLSYDLHEHERVHFQQQERYGGSEAWWDRYLSDVQFRLDQEVEAYRAQLAYVDAHFGRTSRRHARDYICSTLASAMYGNLVSKKQAAALLQT
jgi:hypothetical protein